MLRNILNTHFICNIESEVDIDFVNGKIMHQFSQYIADYVYDSVKYDSFDLDYFQD